MIFHTLNLLLVLKSIIVDTSCTYQPRVYFHKKIYVPYRKLSTVREFLTTKTIKLLLHFWTAMTRVTVRVSGPKHQNQIHHCLNMWKVAKWTSNSVSLELNFLVKYETHNLLEICFLPVSPYRTSTYFCRHIFHNIHSFLALLQVKVFLKQQIK